MKLSDLKAGSNTKQTLLLPVASPYPVEITAICGSQPGKTLIVTAGIHGCEYVGIEALNRLKKELDPAGLSGRGCQTNDPCGWPEFKPHVSR